jgi:hypothetical protein
LGLLRSNSTGGLWYSSLENVGISGFYAENIWLRGGTSTSTTPNQFLIFKNILSFRDNSSGNTASRSLKMTGQNGQILILGGEYDGAVYGQKYGTNIEISKEYQADGVTSLGGNSGYAIKFDNVTSQSADLVALVDNAVSVKFDTCYFEKANKTARVVNTAWNVGFNNCEFLNSATDGSGGGYGVSVESFSFATIENNYFGGTTVDLAVKGDTQHKGIVLRNNHGTVTSTGVTKRITPSSASVAIDNHRSIMMDGFATTITTITSSVAAGERIVIKALAALTLGTGGNLTLGGKSTLRLETDEACTFTKVDLGGTLILTGVSKSNEASVKTASATETSVEKD